MLCNLFRRHKLTKTRWLEAGILAPSALVFAQALPFGIFITGCALVIGLWAPSTGQATKWLSIQPILFLFLMMIGATAGLASLWLTVVLGPEWVLARNRRKRKVLAGLFTGIASAVYWLSIQGPSPQNASSSKVFLIWIALVIGPFAIGMKYLFVLCFFKTRPN